MSGINRLAANNSRYQSPIPDDSRDKLNYSQVNLNFASTTASNSVTGNTSSSKAVLGALRALQDKIRRLEAEKTQILDETKQLRLQIQNQEIEFDHSKQKEKLSLQKNLHEIRASYDSVLSEKNELELRVAKLDERNKELRLQSDDQYHQLTSFESEKNQLEHKYKDLESMYLQMEGQLERSRQREQELAQSVAKESSKHEDEHMKMVMQLEQLNEALNSTIQDKSVHDKRLGELDELVMQLLNLNEVLISKLTESNTSNVVYKKILGIPKKPIEPAPSSDSVKTHVRSTSATRFSSFGATTNPPLQITKSKEKMKEKEYDIEVDEDVTRLNNLHKMYKGLARVIMENRDNSPRQRNGTNDSNATNKKKKMVKNFTEKIAANNGKSSSTFYNNSSASAVAFDPRDLSALTLAAELRHNVHSPSIKQLFQNSRISNINELDFGPYPSSSNSLRNQTSPFVQRSLRSPGKPELDRIVASNAAASSNGVNQVQKVISSLEEEYESLSSQYRRLLMTMQRDPAASDPAFPVNDSMKQFDEITNILQQLQRKGEQLRNLRGN